MVNSRELLLGAFKGESYDRIPIWFMRQAGRYLPEYMAIREGSTFEKRSQTPELAAEITLQPIDRFDLDAAIIFSDILIPIYDMELGLTIIPERGPIIERPIKTEDDVYNLKETNAEDNFAYLPKSIALVREKIPNKALIGFSGAPFTLASYLLEGKSTRNALLTKSFALTKPKAFHDLMEFLTKIVINQLKSEVDAGADFVQVFDSWAGFLSPEQFEIWSLPYLKKIFGSFNNTPSIFYARGSSHLIQFASQTGANGVSVDTTVKLTDAEKTNPNMLLQGNLDPAYLLTTPDLVKGKTLEILNQGKSLTHSKYIFNLGQGIDRFSKLENVEMMVNTVKSFRR